MMIYFMGLAILAFLLYRTTKFYQMKVMALYKIAVIFKKDDDFQYLIKILNCIDPVTSIISYRDIGSFFNFLKKEMKKVEKTL